jgi:hypothetical protein
VTFNGLSGVISQEIAIFTTTAVRTSNPTKILEAFENLKYLRDEWN